MRRGYRRRFFEARVFTRMIMPKTQWVQRVRAGLGCLVVVAAPIVSSAAPPGVINVDAPAVVKDVALGPNGSLTGFVRNADGRGKSGELVAVAFSGRSVATVQTLEDGRFTIEGLREGTHVLKASGTSWPVRFWRADKAPPAANSGVTLVSRNVPSCVGDEVVLVPNGRAVPCDPAVPAHSGPRPGFAPRRGFLGRTFANYPILTTAALLGAGIGAGIAIGTGSDSTPASP